MICQEYVTLTRIYDNACGFLFCTRTRLNNISLVENALKIQSADHTLFDSAEQYDYVMSSK